MNAIKNVLPYAGAFLLVGAGCASQRYATESPSPTAQRVEDSQQQSEQALERAHQAQKQATEAQQRAEAAQAQVREDQERLAQDQAIARQEQAKAQQLQAKAARERSLATSVAQREQQRAERGLSQQTELTAKGLQIAAGTVTQVRPDEITIQPDSGEMMKFVVNRKTQVRIGGERGSAGQIKEGSEARVSYETSRNGATAVSINVGGAQGSQQ